MTESCVSAIDKVKLVTSSHIPILDQNKNISNNRKKFDVSKVGCEVIFTNLNYHSKMYLKHDDGRILPFRCKSWKCPTCYPKNKLKLMIKVARIARKYGMRYFWTFTIDRDHSTALGSYAYISKIWNKFLIIYKRETGHNLKFVRVIESHKDGYAHIHFLTADFIPVNWVRIKWQVLGGGKMNRVEKVDIQRVSAYVSKYFSKANLNLPKYVRHYSTNLLMDIWIPEKGWRLMIYSEEFQQERKVDRTDFSQVSVSNIRTYLRAMIT